MYSKKGLISIFNKRTHKSNALYIMKRIILFCLLILLNLPIFGQTRTSPSAYEISLAPKWAKLFYSENPNYLEVEKEYQKYFRNHEFKKDNHVRNYLYWKKNYGNYLNEKGYLDYNLANKTNPHSKVNSRNCSGNWSVIGPIESYDTQGNPSSDQSNVFCIDQSKSDSNILYCGTESGEIYKSTDHGENWFNVSLEMDFFGNYSRFGIRSIAIHPSNPNIAYFCVGNLIGKTTNGGQTWQYVYNHSTNWWEFESQRIIINPQNPNQLFVATGLGLLTSSNAGGSWSMVFTQPTYDVCFKPSNPQIVYALRKNAATNNHEFVKSTNNGFSFTPTTNGWYNSNDPNRTIEGGRIAVSANDPNRVYAYLIGDAKAGDGGFIGLYKSSDSGNSWSLPNGPTGGPYSTAHPNLANASHLGTGHHQGSYNCALLVSPTNANHILIGGNNLWKSEDGGTTFFALGGYENGPLNNTIHEGSIHVDMQEFTQVGSTTWITTDGGIYKSNDFFSSTNFAKKDKGIHSMDFWGLGQGWNEDILFAGSYHNGNIALYENWGLGNAMSLGGGEPATGYVNPGDDRLVYSSEIQGRFLPLNIGDPVKNAPFGIKPNESYWTLDAFSELEFSPNSFNIAYTGKDHQLWKTTDKGQTFYLLNSFGTDPGDKITFIEISRENPDIIYVSQQHSSNYSSSVHKSIDGGLTWNPVNLPSNSNSSRKIALQVDPYNPNNIWVGFNHPGNNCKIFHSQNGGLTWTDKTTPTIASSNLNTLTFIPGTNNGVYIGTNSIMYYKNDAMSDWICFSNNLPPVTITFHAKPFYRDGKIRIATIKGFWESPLYEEPNQPFAQASVNKITSNKSACLQDTLLFVDHSIVNHQNATWEWDFGPNATPSTSNNIKEKVVFNSIGTYQVILTVTNGSGSWDRDTLEVEINNNLSLNQTFSEDFENGIPNQAFRLINHENNAVSWYLNDSLSAFGTGNNCMAIQGFYASAGSVDDIEFDINLEFVDTPIVNFDVAYARYANNYTDTLEVLISTDCGATFQSLYLKGNSDLATAPDANTPFYPSTNQWRTDSVDLSAYTNFDQALLVFRDHQGWGQNMFLDNIQLNGVNLPPTNVYEEIKPKLAIYPNPVNTTQSVHIQQKETSPIKVELFSTQGKLVFSKGNILNNQFIIPSNLSSGAYAFRISSTNIIKHGVLVIK